VLVNDEEDLAGSAGGDESGALADRAGAADGGRDAAEEGFERGAADRAGSRDDRREQSRVARALRDRAILIQQNADLQARLAAVEAERAKDRANGYGAELTRAEREIAEAVSAGDADAIARANRRVAELAAGRTAAALAAQDAAEQATARAREATAAQHEQQDRPEPSRTTAEWLRQNSWWGQDARMTAQARLLHAEAVQEEGMEPDSPGYWRYIEGGLEARFPGRVKPLYLRSAAKRAAGADGGGDDAEAADPAAAARVPARAVSGAAPVSRASADGVPASAGQSLRLSAEAVALAKSLGITPQQYAARATALAKKGAINLRNISGGA
jgi:hypothetical protein